MVLAAVEWGTVGEWASGLAGVGALGVSLFVLALELKRNAKDAQRELEAQARKVAAWIYSWGASKNGAGDPLIQLTFAVVNGSDEPVYDVMVNSHDFATGWTTTLKHYPALGPGAHIEAEVAGTPGKKPDQDEIRRRGWSRPQAQITFVDSAGRRWQRDPDGSLRVIEDPAVTGLSIEA